MTGLAIYTVVLFGVELISLILKFDRISFLGAIFLIPVVVFAILYLVRL